MPKVDIGAILNESSRRYMESLRAELLAPHPFWDAHVEWMKANPMHGPRSPRFECGAGRVWLDEGEFQFDLDDALDFMAAADLADWLREWADRVAHSHGMERL